MALKSQTFSYTFLGVHILVAATSVPPVGGSKIPCNFNRLFKYAGSGEITRFDHFVEMGMKFFNKWLES